jgi:hypothetical protein
MLKRFEDILAQCIEDIKAGRASIEGCLDRYPSLREQLEPLLRIALGIRETPDVKPSPAFKLRARVRLMDQIHERRAVTKWPWSRHNGQIKPITYRRRFDMTSILRKPKVWKPVVASLAVLFLAVSVYMVFLAPRAVASLALQVNPAVTLTLDERNIVIEAKGLDERGDLLLAGLDVIDKEVSEALLVIARALHEAGLLEDGRRMLISLQSVEGRIGEAELTILTDAVSQTLQGYVAEHRLLVVVVSVSLTAELADAVHAAGLLPADYVDLVKAVGPQTAVKVLALQGELGLDLALFKEELGTIAAVLKDMTDAGITVGNALAILKSSLAADQTLEELATITAAMIDLHEAGATQENIMAVFQLVEERVAANVTRNLLLEEFTTITGAKIDMLDAGITGTNATAILNATLIADPTLEELATITAAMIDLVDEGLTPKVALDKIRAAIAKEPTLQTFDDLIGLEPPEKEEQDPDRPQRPQRRLPQDPANAPGSGEEVAVGNR